MSNRSDFSRRALDADEFAAHGLGAAPDAGTPAHDEVDELFDRDLTGELTQIISDHEGPYHTIPQGLSHQEETETESPYNNIPSFEEETETESPYNNIPSFNE